MKRWIRYVMIAIVVIFAIGTFALASMYYYDTNYSKEDYENFNEETWNKEQVDIMMEDNNNIYDLDKPLEVNEIYVTVLKDQKQRYTFEDIKKANDIKGETDIKLNVFFETEDKSILNNGLFMKEPNGTIEIKGKSSQKSPIKSFKIMLDEKAGLWNGQNVINLNKNYFDSIRVRNKLAFDYMSTIPNIISFRTDFVRLFVRDLTSEDKEATFEDYGFFTHVEQPNKLFLKNHSLDPKGNLYKAIDFDFSYDHSVLKEKNTADYSKKDFEKHLEIQGDDNHSKLINMVKEVDNSQLDIDDIIDKYFYKENYLTYLAINILFDNYNCGKENYMLYSMLNSNKWYFIPWDFDDAFNNEKSRAQWQRGISMLWSNKLHRSFLSKSSNVEALTKKIQELEQIVNKENSKNLLDKYYEILMSNITKVPDFRYLLMELPDVVKEYKTMPETIEKNKEYYYESLKNPMAFKVEKIWWEEGSLYLDWENSYSISNADISYDVDISQDETFEKLDYCFKDLKDTNLKVDNVSKGIYYIKIISKNNIGGTQQSYSIYDSPNLGKIYGIDAFEVK